MPLALLFVGNSYVFVNELDQTTGALFLDADPTGETLAHREATGGYTLPLHLADADGTNGGQTMLLMTWGRRDGDATNPDGYPDYPTMQAKLAEGYLRYAAAINTDTRTAWVAPTGYGFRHVWQEAVDAGEDPLDPAARFYRLYIEDGSHPSPLGTCLAACVIYSSISGDVLSVSGAGSRAGRVSRRNSRCARGGPTPHAKRAAPPRRAAMAGEVCPSQATWLGPSPASSPARSTPEAARCAIATSEPRVTPSTGGGTTHTSPPMVLPASSIAVDVSGRIRTQPGVHVASTLGRISPPRDPVLPPPRPRRPARADGRRRLGARAEPARRKRA